MSNEWRNACSAQKEQEPPLKTGVTLFDRLENDVRSAAEEWGLMEPICQALKDLGVVEDDFLDHSVWDWEIRSDPTWELNYFGRFYSFHRCIDLNPDILIEGAEHIRDRTFLHEVAHILVYPDDRRHGELWKSVYGPMIGIKPVSVRRGVSITGIKLLAKLHNRDPKEYYYARTEDC